MNIRKRNEILAADMFCMNSSSFASPSSDQDEAFCRNSSGVHGAVEDAALEIPEIKIEWFVNWTVFDSLTICAHPWDKVMYKGTERINKVRS